MKMNKVKTKKIKNSIDIFFLNDHSMYTLLKLFLYSRDMFSKVDLIRIWFLPLPND